MKKPLAPPLRLTELRQRVVSGLVDMDTEQRLHILLSLSGGLDDPLYRSWEYYFRAEPVPEGLTREAWWCAVRGARAATARPGTDDPQQRPRPRICA